MRRRLREAIGLAALSAAAGLCGSVRGHAVSLDTNSEITLGIRAYTAARVGSENTDISLINKQAEPCFGTAPGTPCQQFRSLTFPVSAAGHLRQSRYFLEADFKHRLDPLIHDFRPYQFTLNPPFVGTWINTPLDYLFNFGRYLLLPFRALDHLPFKVRQVGYTLVFRGEYDGVYDYGPAEYRTAYQYRNPALILPFGNSPPLDPLPSRRRLRDVASNRERLFQAFVEGVFGPVFVRFGRQILAWGETDVFRLLDNINPIDNSFGGFLIPLDERRVPLDMLRASYTLPHVDFLPFSEMFLEGYGAVDNSVAYEPGIPNGSPWQLPNFTPSTTLLTRRNVPPANFANARGGVQLKLNTPMPLLEEASFAIAHYYTYLDVPAVQTFVGGQFPLAIPETLPGAGYQALAVQSAPTTQITGVSSTFAIPAEYVRSLGLSGEPIVRTELAYFHNEARFTQAQLDPFFYALPACGTRGGTRLSDGRCTGGRRTGDSWNFVLGLDLNQFIRTLNERQSFFISTQFFYKHLKHPAAREPLPTLGGYLPGQPRTFDGEVLPVPSYYISPNSQGLPFQNAVEAVFVHNPADQFLQTLLIATAYYSGQIVPALGVFYDWSGAVVAQPQITFSRDPLRFTLGYSYLYASTLKGASGISLLRDRDNVLFQLEYVL